MQALEKKKSIQMPYLSIYLYNLLREARPLVRKGILPESGQLNLLVEVVGRVKWSSYFLSEIQK